MSASVVAQGDGRRPAMADPNNDVVEADETNNTARKFLADVPDLGVGLDNLTVTPAALG